MDDLDRYDILTLGDSLRKVPGFDERLGGACVADGWTV